MSEKTKRKKWFENVKMPHTYVILITILVIMTILTHIIPAGQYQVEELPLTARYILTDASSSDPNVTVKNTLLDTVNGIQKIRSEITADLTMEDGSVIFENRKVFFDEYSHDDVEVNHLKASEEKNGKKQ